MKDIIIRKIKEISDGMISTFEPSHRPVDELIYNTRDNYYDYDEIEPILLPKYSQPQPLSLNDLESKNNDENNSLEQMMEE